MNAQVQPTIEQLRHSLCTQLIGAGITNPNDIVNTAQAIEKFIFAGPETVLPTAQSKTKEPVAEIKNAEPVQEQTPAATEEKTSETKIEFADIKAGLMRVAKADRNAFDALKAKFNFTNITQIQEADYPAVMSEVEKFEAENA
ncbi:hypothetical protein [Acinetobacter wuhouensis]|uniref:Uncharacterized protein n=1 Tax=Acinetobacter wuhouensis TaxID=1879050 RepID=A0A4Q7AHV6_9GAMM|nr:hypothetical protein [Acinetobacter wuhouensis]RZG47024.1 hypothetical protein EXU28_07490 [Acinetobacter wuhouensis]